MEHVLLPMLLASHMTTTSSYEDYVKTIHCQGTHSVNILSTQNYTQVCSGGKLSESCW